MGWFATRFEDLPDPRTGNATRHNLLDLLTIALTATICGAESCVDFADFARDRATLFASFLELPGGLPSHDTFSRLFHLLDPTAFAGCFGDWLFRLKANRPAMLAAVTELFANPPAALAEHVTVDADHGRIETRRHLVSHDVAWLTPTRREADQAPPAGLASIAMIEARTEAAGRTTSSRRYYASSATLSPERFAHAARAHWSIEATHWILDTTFNEDQARNRADHGPENLATLRKLALNILRSARTDISIRRKRKRSGWSNEFATSILGQMR